MNCQQCGSRHLKTLPYMHEMGTYYTNDGVALREWDDDAVSNYVEHHTKLGHAARPPERARQVDSAVCLIAGCVVMLFGLQFGLPAVGAGALIVLLGLYLAWRHWRYNTGPYRHAYAQWQESFICIDCGHIAGTLPGTPQ